MFTMGEITSDTRRCSMAWQAPLGWDTGRNKHATGRTGELKMDISSSNMGDILYISTYIYI